MAKSKRSRIARNHEPSQGFKRIPTNKQQSLDCGGLRIGVADRPAALKNARRAAPSSGAARLEETGAGELRRVWDAASLLHARTRALRECPSSVAKRRGDAGSARMHQVGGRWGVAQPSAAAGSGGVSPPGAARIGTWTRCEQGFGLFLV